MPRCGSGALASRRIETAYGLVAVVWMGLLVWERVSPDGPQLAWERVRAGVREWRQWREAMRRTLDEIDALPERPPDVSQSPYGEPDGGTV